MSSHLLLTLALFTAGSPAAVKWVEAGHVPVRLPTGTPQQSEGVPEPEEQASRKLEKKARDYLTAVRALLEILEADLVKARSRSLQFENLYGEGLVSRRERDETVARVGILEARLAKQREVHSSTRLLLSELTQVGTRKRAASLLPGIADQLRVWHIGLVPELANFFWHRFGRELPISAFGQTTTHDHLGFDHTDRVDLALHPGSDEGEAVVQYLRQRGLPFQAFSTPRSGSATGAHIHIGPVSGRLEE